MGNADPQVLKDIVSGNDEQTDNSEVSQKNLYEGEDCQIRLTGYIRNTEDRFQKILAKVADQGSLLENLTNINQGIISGVDKISQKHIDKFPDLDLVKGEGIYAISLEQYSGQNWSRF